VRYRVGALVDLSPGERTQLVHDHCRAGVTDGSGDHRGRRRGTPPDRSHTEPGELVRSHRRHQACAGEDAHVLGFVQQTTHPPASVALHRARGALCRASHVLQAAADPTSDLTGGDQLGHRSQQSARHVVPETELHPGATATHLAETEVAALVDAGHAGPREIVRRVVLYDLHGAPHLGGSHREPHGVAGTRAGLLLGVLGVERGNTVQQGRVPDRIGEELPHILYKRVDDDLFLDPHWCTPTLLRSHCSIPTSLRSLIRSPAASGPVAAR